MKADHRQQNCDKVGEVNNLTCELIVLRKDKSTLSSQLTELCLEIAKKVGSCLNFSLRLLNFSLELQEMAENSSSQFEC